MKKIQLALVAAAVAALAPLAHAQKAGDIVARFRAVQLEPANEDSISITDVSVNSKLIPEVDFTYFFTPNIAAELVLTVPQKHDVNSTAHGGKIGTLKHLPPTLSVQYHFTDVGAAKPYVGLGLNYTRFSQVSLPAGFTIDKNSYGLSFQAGMDFAITPTVSLNLDIKKVRIRTDLYSAGTNLGTIKVDPTLFGVGIGYKF